MDLISNLNRLYRAPEAEVVRFLLQHIETDSAQDAQIAKHAHKLIEAVRSKKSYSAPIDRLMDHYDLSSADGMALMALAEAYMRIPDTFTKDALLKDKLSGIDASMFLKQDKGWVSKTVSQALKVTQTILNREAIPKSSLQETGETLSKPFIRAGVTQVMRLLVNKFVIAQSIDEALAKRDPHNAYSYDILGEAACTRADAEHYFNAYLKAIKTLQNQEGTKGELSVKLSALHPRYEFAKQDIIIPELTQSLKTLALAAQEAGINLVIDAENADCLELSLRIFEILARDKRLQDWQGLGLAVQAYQKRSTTVIDWLIELSQECKKRLRVRLVKGAYWDSEIKWAQEKGLKDYPVFTRKQSTDVSFLYCAQRMLAHPKEIFAAFGTHNAHSIASILAYAKQSRDFEFQRLFGMGQDLYHHLLNDPSFNVPVRVYAPVGEYQELLPYLVRRLLENGANSSFLNAVHNLKIPIKDLVKNPIQELRHQEKIPHPKIPLPKDIYLKRQNSSGIDLSNRDEIKPILDSLAKKPQGTGAPIINGISKTTASTTAHSPIDKSEIGQVSTATPKDIEEALSSAHNAFHKWMVTSIQEKAHILERMATLIEDHRINLISLCVYEGGKTIADSIAEVREAVDSCRYYAQQVQQNLADPLVLQGPTGEKNMYRYKGRGVFLCISPWNFPLAIFTGQVVAALVSGNCVLAKPSSQTPMIAWAVINLMHKAGIPNDVLHLIPSPGKVIASQLIPDARIAGICFTGSTDTSWQINRTLAARQSSIVPFIAETGGQNAMVVDSSALPEQVIKDVLSSAFNSAGQRCSALRLLLIQEETAWRIKEMLKGAMAELSVGDPRQLATDVGPLIDNAAMKKLHAYRAILSKSASLIMETPLSHELAKRGNYIAPCAYDIKSFDLLKEEHFGPILHVMTYKAPEIEAIISKANDLGFGLTFGLHTRINTRIMPTADQIQAGNIYVNRNIIGAVVGVQPFGGQGLSGTGPKAGGPQYLYRFMHEQSISINTTAQGGNTTLLTLTE